MLNKNWIALFAIAALFASASCNRSKRKVIAVVPKATSHIFWLSVKAGAEAAGKALDVDVQWNGPAAETEYDRQIQIIDSMVAQHVDGIAVAAAERKALVQAVDRATKAGIPVTVFDSGLDCDCYMTFLATNNYEAGQLAARALAELIEKKGSIVVVRHTPGSFSTMDRERGFEDAIKNEFPDIKIAASQYGMSDRTKARAAMENMMSANPTISGVFASTEPSSIGAALALKSAGKAGKIKFVAFDSSDSMIEDLKGGTIDAMVVQDPYKMGYDSVKLLVDRIAGKIPEKRIDLHAKVVRKSDLDTPEFKDLLNPLGRK